MFDDFELQLPRWKRKKSYCGIYIDYVYYKHVFALFCASSLDASQAHRPRYLVEFSSNVVPSIKELSDKGHSDLMVFWGLKKMWGAQNCRILWCTITESVIFTVIRCWICSMVQTWISMNTVYIYIYILLLLFSLLLLLSFIIFYYLLLCIHICYYVLLFIILFFICYYVIVYYYYFTIIYFYLLLRIIIYYYVFYLLSFIIIYYYLSWFTMFYCYLLFIIIH